MIKKDPLSPKELAEMKALLKEEQKAYDLLEKEMDKDIEERFTEIKTDFEKIRAASPYPAKTTENKIKEFEDDLFIENPGNETLAELSGKKNYVKNYPLKGKRPPALDKRNLNLGTEREMVVEVEAKLRFLLILKSQNHANRLPQPAIALIHYYNSEPITSDNNKEIAQRYGYNLKKSGHSLYQTYQTVVDTPRYNAEIIRSDFCKKYESQIIESGLLKNDTAIKKFKAELEKNEAHQKKE